MAVVVTNPGSAVMRSSCCVARPYVEAVADRFWTRALRPEARLITSAGGWLFSSDPRLCEAASAVVVVRDDY